MKLDEDYPLSVILYATAFTDKSIYNSKFQASPSQMLFSRYVIIIIGYISDWVAITENLKSDKLKTKYRIKYNLT